MSAVVASFVEEVCHDGDRLREHGPQAVFTLETVGKILGRRGLKFRLNETVRGDLRVWYDPNDLLLLELLSVHIPDVEWGRFVFWRKSDHSAIEIIDPETDELAARLIVRQSGRGPSGEIDWTNVACLITRDQQIRAAIVRELRP